MNYNDALEYESPFYYEDNEKNQLDEIRNSCENLKRIKFDDGSEYMVYIPDNVNPDTPVHFYYHGAGTAELYSHNCDYNVFGVQDILMNNKPDAIVAMIRWNNPDDVKRTTEKAFEHLKNSYNLSGNNTISSSGFSNGVLPAIDTVSSYNNGTPSIGVLIDPETLNLHWCKDYNVNPLSRGLVESNSIIFALGNGYGKQRLGLQKYVDAGVNVILVTSTSDDIVYKVNGSTGIDGHMTYNQQFYLNGFFDFTIGKGPLPKKGYNFEVYNVETGMWQPLDVSKINSIEELYACFGIDIYSVSVNNILSLNSGLVMSNNPELKAYLDNISNKITSTNFISNRYTVEAMESTSKIPSYIPRLISDFFSINTELLLKISREIVEYAKVGDQLEWIEKNLTSIQEGLGGNGGEPTEQEPTEKPASGSSSGNASDDSLSGTGTKEPINPPKDKGEYGDDSNLSGGSANDGSSSGNASGNGSSSGNASDDSLSGTGTKEPINPPKDKGEYGDDSNLSGGSANDGSSSGNASGNGSLSGNASDDSLSGTGTKEPINPPKDKGEYGDDSNLSGGSANDGSSSGNTSGGSSSGNTTGGSSSGSTSGGSSSGSTSGSDSSSGNTSGSGSSSGNTSGSDSSSGNTSGSGSSSGNTSGGSTNSGYQSQPDNPTTGGGIEPPVSQPENSSEVFWSYNEVYTDDSKLVYEVNDEYKIILHTVNDKIVGMEHYYDFGSKENAMEAINKLFAEYGDDLYFKEILQSDRYVKVIFDKKMFENLSVDYIKQLYSHLVQIFK